MANCQQQILFSSPLAGGTFLLSLNGYPTVAIDFDAVDADIVAALKALPVIGDNNVQVNTWDGETLVIEFISELVNTPISQVVSDASGATALIDEDPDVTEDTLGIWGLNELQSIDLGDAAAGTWTVTFDGYTTGDLAWDISAGSLETAMEGLTSIGSGNIDVTNPSTGLYILEFKGALANTNVSAVTVNGDSLTDNVPVVDTFTTPGDATWTAPANLFGTTARVAVQGGGGDGGDSGGGGGAGGGYAEGIFTVAASTGYAYHVADHGDAGTSNFIDASTLYGETGQNGDDGPNGAGGARGNGGGSGASVAAFNGGDGQTGGAPGDGGGGGAGAYGGGHGDAGGGGGPNGNIGGSNGGSTVGPLSLIGGDGGEGGNGGGDPGEPGQAPAGGGGGGGGTGGDGAAGKVVVSCLVANITPSVTTLQAGQGAQEVQTITMPTGTTSGTWSIAQTDQLGALFFYKMSEAHGLNRVESVGGTVNLVDVVDVATTTSAENIGNAVSFDGTTYLYNPNDDHQLGSTSWTLSFAIRIPSFGPDGYFLLGREGEWEIRVGPSPTYNLIAKVFTAAGSVTLTSATSMSDHFLDLAVWYDLPNQILSLSVYGGGAQTIDSGPIVDGGADFRIGKIDSEDGLAFDMDTLRFWKRLLTSDERSFLPVAHVLREASPTTTLDWDATAGEVETAIETVTGLGVSVSGSNGGPWTVTWDDYAPHDVLVANDIDLIGGTASSTDSTLVSGSGVGIATGANGSAVDAGGGDVAWTSPSSASPGAGSASVALADGEVSSKLQLTGFGSGVIPGGNYAIGIEFTLYVRSDNGFIKEFSIKTISVPGLVAGANRASGIAWAMVDEINWYGRNGDRWGRFWIPTDALIDGFGFGLELQVTADGGDDVAYVDYAIAFVYYSPTPPPGPSVQRRNTIFIT